MTIKGVPLDNSANESVLPDDFVYPPGSYAGGTISSFKEAGDPSKFAKDGNGITYGFNGIPYFNQYDERWAKKPFGLLPTCTCQNNPSAKSCNGKASNEPIGDDGSKFGKICCTDIAHGGCNVTSYAMVLRTYNKPVDPEIMAAMAVESGARTCNWGITDKLETFHKAIRARWPTWYLKE